MSRRAKRQRNREFKLRQRAMKLLENEKIYDLAKTAMQSPVLAGTGAFLLVHTIESASKSGALTSSIVKQQGQQPQQAQSWFSLFWSIFSNLAIPGTAIPGTGAAGLSISGAATTLTDALKNLDFSALKLVILIYIASGGNLPGLLQQSGGILTDALKSLGIATAIGGVAP